MAKVKRRFIVITSEGPVWEFGGPFAPLTIPFKCNVKSILNLIKYEQLEVYGINAAGAKVRLDETNYDDSDAPADRDIPSSPPSGSGSSSGGNPPPPPPPSAPTLKPPNVPPPPAKRYSEMTPSEKKTQYEGIDGFDSSGELQREPDESDESYNNRQQHAGDSENGYDVYGHKDPSFVPGTTHVDDRNKPYAQMTPDERKKYRGGKPGFDENGVLLQRSNESDEEYLKRCNRASSRSHTITGDKTPLNAESRYYPRLGEDLSRLNRREFYSYMYYENRAATKPNVIKRKFAGQDGFDPETGFMLKRPGESDADFKMRKKLAGTFGFDYLGNRKVLQDEDYSFRIR